MPTIPKKSIDNTKYCLNYLKRCNNSVEICKALNDFLDDELLDFDKIEALARRYNCVYDSDLN